MPSDTPFDPYADLAHLPRQQRRAIQRQRAKAARRTTVAAPGVSDEDLKPIDPPRRPRARPWQLPPPLVR